MKQMKTNVRDTSLDAYFYVRGMGIDLKQCGKIYAYMNKHLKLGNDIGYTRNELSMLTGIRLSSVCARVNEMIADDWLTDDEKRKCSVTGKEDHVVRVKK